MARGSRSCVRTTAASSPRSRSPGSRVRVSKLQRSRRRRRSRTVLSNASHGDCCAALLLGTSVDGDRNALIIDAELRFADGYADRSSAVAKLARLPPSKRRRTAGAHKGCDTAGFVADSRSLGFTPHVAPHTNGRRSAIDGRAARHPGPSSVPADLGPGRRNSSAGSLPSAAVASSATRAGTGTGPGSGHHRRLQHRPHHFPRRRRHLTRHAGLSANVGHRRPRQSPTPNHPDADQGPAASNRTSEADFPHLLEQWSQTLRRLTPGRARSSAPEVDADPDLALAVDGAARGRPAVAAVQHGGPVTARRDHVVEHGAGAVRAVADVLAPGP